MGKKRKIQSTNKSGESNEQTHSNSVSGRPKRSRNNSSKNNNSSRGNRMWVGSSGSSARRKTSSRSTSYSSSSPRVDVVAIQEMFCSIADENNPEIATMEGLAKLCEDMGIDPYEDIRVLVLLWKLGAYDKPGQINKEEWMKGCTSLEVDSIEKLQKLLPSLDTGFLTRSEFKNFHQFAFKFNREGTHKTLDKDLVLMLLKLVLKDIVNVERIENFSEFLESTTDENYGKITLDQWSSFLDFCYEYEDLDTYDDEMSAWPILIDDFVDYMKKKA